ncbi:unnamed protein product [Sphagnum balticum]
MHKVCGNVSCTNAEFNSSLCPNVTTCGKSYEVEGVDYSSHGIRAVGDTLTLNLFSQKDNVTTEASPRVYLLANETIYDVLTLLNQEFTFDVDM